MSQSKDFQWQLFEKDFELLKKDVDSKEQLQKQETEFLKKEIEQQKVSVANSIERQEKYIQSANTSMSRWVGFFGAWVTLISIGVAVLGWYTNKRAESSEKKVKEELENIRELRQQIEMLKGKAEQDVAHVEKRKADADGYIDKMEKIIKTIKQTNVVKPEDASEEEKQDVKEIVQEIDNLKPEAELSAEDWLLKGYFAQIESNLEDACFYYSKAAKLKPDNASTYYNWGIALSDLAKQKLDESLYKESFEKYKKAIELKPDYTNAYLNWGIALSDLAKQKENLMSYKNEIEELLLKAESLEKGGGSYNLACLYSLLNQPTKALEYLETSLKIEKDISRKSIEQDDDFENIRNTPAFEQLLDKYFATNN